MHSSLAMYCFWISVSLLLYTLVVFPLLVILRGLLRYRPVRSAPWTPKISLIIAAYNEAAIIRQKLDNTFTIDYPPDCMDVVVASDGSEDGTDELVARYGGSKVKLLVLPRQGKNQALNDAVAIADGEILVFTDADAMISSDALRYLTAPFKDPDVGCVAGDYRHSPSGNQGAGERDYWNVERAFKRLQSRAGSVTSAWGPIYAIRKELFSPIPKGVTDDYYTSVQSVAAGQRLIFEPRAIAVGPVAASAQVEFQRKVRIISAGLRGVWRTRHLLNPFIYGFFSLQLFSHKLLRRLMWLPLLLLVFSAPMLWEAGWFYQLSVLGQAILHGGALLGFLLQGTPLGQAKLLRLPFFLDMACSAAVVACFKLLRPARYDIWTPQHYEETK